ncbi:MAG TPA: hypothetical protein VK357_10180 [Rubrobacteraceae bacterium]|jgi:hypothetical protein|nr:hypothetical protein [Rubrobacteraceae bacterium]
MSENKPQGELNTEAMIQVRRVTNIHANWNEEGRGEPGKFSFQLVLDDGAEEYAIRPPAEDAEVIVELISKTDVLYFDTERKVLIFSNLSLG